MSPLERCVGDLETFTSAWGQRPLVVTGDPARSFDGILNLDDVDRFISTSARTPTVRMVLDGVPVDPRRYCRSMRLGGKHVDDVVDPRLVSDQVRNGATLVLQSLHRTTSGVAAFATDLQQQVSHPVQANAYLTPPDAAGLAEHADPHDVIVLQLHGSKRWWVEGVGDFDLRLGDSMYVPAGARHRASTTGESSLHLTLGIIRVTYRDILRRTLAGGPESLDDPLPIGYRDPARSTSEMGCRIHTMFEDVRLFLARTDIEATVEREVRRRPTCGFSAGHLTALLLRNDLGADTRVRWVAPAPMGRLVSSDPWRPIHDLDVPPASTVEVDMGDRVLTIPSVALAAIGALRIDESVRIGDLPGLDPPSQIVLGRRLIEETACVIDSSGPDHATSA